MADLSSDTVHAPYGALPRGGVVRPITRWGEPVMHRRSSRSRPTTTSWRALVADMVETMYAADGVGLAACQIGVDRAVFVFDCPDDGGQRTVGVVCNPELSCPRARTASSTRATRAASPTRARSSSARGRTSPPSPAPGWTARRSSSPATGMLARCLQHETDHTHGTVFGDRLPTKLRKKLQKAMEKAADDYPPDWPA